MLERLKELRSILDRTDDEGAGETMVELTPIRIAAAQLLVATGAVTALAQSRRSNAAEEGNGRLPRPIAWAPLVVAAVAAAAQLEHARNPSQETAMAVRFLNGATIAMGGTLLVYDLLRPDRRGSTQMGPLALASAGLLGVAVERHEEEMRLAERELRRRAEVVERLIPRRRAKLDRVVVHV